MKVVGIIPSRLQSTRLPNKALADIEGLPMIGHVLRRSQMAPILDEVIVATDSPKIFKVVSNLGGKVVMTSSQHKTGTDRIAEVAKSLDADIVVNIQGDEPLLNPDHIGLAVEALIQDPATNIAILVVPYTKKSNPSVIKAVLDKNNYIMYSSRNDLPSETRIKVDCMWKMSFIVPFRRDFLLKFTSWPETPLERVEYNEFLRILENGYKIKAVPISHAHISVDTSADLEEVRSIMRSDALKSQYLP